MQQLRRLTFDAQVRAAWGSLTHRRQQDDSGWPLQEKAHHLPGLAI